MKMNHFGSSIVDFRVLNRYIMWYRVTILDCIVVKGPATVTLL